MCKIVWLLAALLCVTLLNAQTPTPSDAQALERQGKLPEAAEAWKAITAYNPRDAAAFASWGVVLSRLGNHPDAASAYRKALALNPNLPGIQLNLGLAEFKQGRFPEAIPPLRAALAADSHSVQARTLLGLSYYGTQRFAEAARYLKVAAHMLMGEALDGLERPADAIAEFQAAVKAAPREPGVHFGLGFLYWKSGQYDQAKTEFETELSIDPGYAQALAYLGDVELKMNDLEKALVLLKRAVDARDDIRIAYADMGSIYGQQKKYEEALAAYQRAVKLDPEQPDMHFRLGNLYRQMGNTAASEEEFAKSRTLHKKEDDALLKKLSNAPPAIHP